MDPVKAIILRHPLNAGPVIVRTRGISQGVLFASQSPERNPEDFILCLTADEARDLAANLLDAVTAHLTLDPKRGR